MGDRLDGVVRLIASLAIRCWLVDDGDAFDETKPPSVVIFEPYYFTHAVQAP